MENNNKNFQNEAKNVNENVNQNVQKKQKNEKVKTVILIVIVMILVLVAGIFGGLLLSGNVDKVTNIISGNSENKVENKAGKKVDESKPWVYDADYMKENKKIYSDSKKTEEYACNSNKDLIVPYININSDDAKKINEKIRVLYDEYYEKYGKEKATSYSSEYKVYYHYNLEYDKYVNDNILSVIITLHEGETVVDGGTGGGIYRTYTYNFNLDNLKEASLDEMAVKCGFSSGDVVINKINEWEKKQKEILAKAGVSDIFDGVQANKYIIDGNGKLNFLYRTNTSAAFDHLQPIENGKEIEFFYTEEQAEKSKESKKNTTSQTANTESIDYSVFSSFANLSYKNENFNIKNQEGTYSCEMKFDNTGKPTLDASTVSDVHHEIIFVTNNITNIKQDIAAGTSYVTFDFTAWTAGGDTTGTAQMRFSNVSSNESIGIKVKFNDMLSDFDSNGDYIELNKASKVVKKLSPSGWAGSSMQEVRLCENGNVYHVTYNGEGDNTEFNIISTELIATNADTIEEKINGQAVEAIIVKGKNLNVVKNNESWILFEKN